MDIRWSVAAAFALFAAPVAAASGQDVQTRWTDWGGGYLRGPDSASTTVSTSGAGAPKAKN